MDWKDVLSIIFLLIVIILLVFYWFIPFKEVEFNSSINENSNFSVSNTLESQMQFYSNMRYPNKEISYRIQNCNLKKQDDMKTAISIVDGLTSISFYPVTNNEEITITCDETAKFSGDLFVAGEGGPINITQSESFNVIHKGAITLIRDSNCATPNVATHELLHALGFDHSSNENNIMYPVSKCNQEIGQDTINVINELYSYPSLPDLAFESASASMKGRYLDIEFVVRNNGLKDSDSTNVIVYADNKQVKDINLEEIPIGAGRSVKFSNILILQTSVNELKIAVDSSFPELNKENNEIMLEIKN